MLTDNDLVVAPSIELLSLQEVYSVPGVMATGNQPLPKPYLDFRRHAKPGYRHELMFWLRGDIEEWVKTCAKSPSMLESM